MADQENDDPTGQRFAEELGRILQDATSDPEIIGRGTVEGAADAFDIITSRIPLLTNQQLAAIVAQCLTLGRAINAEIQRRHLAQSKPEGNG